MTSQKREVGVGLGQSRSGDVGRPGHVETFI